MPAYVVLGNKLTEGVNTAIALRPGDVLFFNPLQKHCLSQRTLHYLDEKLYCSAFYLTTKQISGNDNTKIRSVFVGFCI